MSGAARNASEVRAWDATVRTRYQPCHIPPSEGTKDTNGWTNRGLELYYCFFPQWSEWFSRNIETPSQATEGITVLEIGAGSARAILELNARNPLLQVYGTNKAGYGNGQVESVQDMWNSVRNFNVDIQCDKSGKPAWPEIFLFTEGIQTKNLPVGAGTLDFIISRMSLGRPKIQPYESHLVVPRVLYALKAGGSAFLHIGRCIGKESPAWGKQDWVQKLGKRVSFTVIKVVNIGDFASVVLIHNGRVAHSESMRNNVGGGSGCKVGEAYCFSVIVKKCSIYAARHAVTKDCILPPHIQPAEVPGDWLEALGDGEEYLKQYLTNFIKHLDSWAANGLGTDFEGLKSGNLPSANRGRWQRWPGAKQLAQGGKGRGKSVRNRGKDWKSR